MRLDRVPDSALRAIKEERRRFIGREGRLTSGREGTKAPNELRDGVKATKGKPVLVAGPQDATAEER
jgi:hypothetical protein